MRILFISEDLVAGHLAYTLIKEGHDVKLCILDRSRRDNLTNLVPKIADWRKELSWVSRDGLIVFDSCSHGKVQDQLRAKGYAVVGGCELGNKLENDRAYGAAVFAQCGIKTVPLRNFKCISDAIRFVKKNRGMWVIKQNGSGTGLKGLNYVGMREDGEDVIDVLTSYQDPYDGVISLQQKIEGVEIAAGRFFNGIDWVGPIEINLEHKKYFPGDLGPTTSEMGTVAWYDDDEGNRLFSETLAKMKPFLQKIGFRGDIGINCIVNRQGAFPLEATPRFGSPIIHLMHELHESPWGEFLTALALGRPYNLRYKRGVGIVVVVTVPTSMPFPFTKKERYVSPKNLRIHFADALKSDLNHVFFEDVSRRSTNGKDEYYISDDRGYVLYVTGFGDNVKVARSNAYAIIRQIHIPKMFYRNDIGIKFLETDRNSLVEYGYLKA